ncbi:MAG: hypothetical protein WA825_14645 [Steroidobacteraceae bacterium]
MIWHIFKKDARLLWPLAALVAALHVCAAVPHYLVDHGRGSFQIALMGELLSALAMLALAVAVVVAMHQDPIPGTRQDWLIRPVRRLDLALAKLLFIVLMVQLPVWLVDTGIALVYGFALPAAGVAAAERNAQVFCEFALPAMMIGIITRTFVEAFILAAIGLVVYMGVFMVGLSLLLGVKATLGNSGVVWMFSAAFDVFALAGAALILTLQYSGRRTTLARWLVGVGGALIIGFAWLPWPVAFSLQTALSAEPGAAHAVAMAFDPQAGRYRLPLGAAPNVTSALYLPLKFTELPADSSVLLDRADVRISGADGTTLYQGTSNISVDGQGSMLDAQFEVRAGRAGDPIPAIFQRIYLPADVYTRLANRQVRLAVDYSLTMFRPAGSYTLPAVGAHQTLAGLGHCHTSIDAERDDVGIQCMSTEQQPSCFSGFLQHPATGLRNPESHFCFPKYDPAVLGNFWPDALSRTRGEFRFFDRSGMIRFPVDGPKLAGATLNITAFVPRDHFSRHLDTPLVRLADLSGLATEPR